MIYSGIFNSKSGVNELNQFIAGEKITKDINPDYGSIQKIYSRNNDLLTLCEDRVLTVLANKDALFNADGNPQLIATDRVLGQAVAIPGEYGISKNPESFAAYSNKCYFTDATRGSVMRISGSSLQPISEVGMSDYFSDTLTNSFLQRAYGSFDEKKYDYNISIEIGASGDTYASASSNATVTWSEKSSGWSSFKTFYPEQGLSINNNYYTWKEGKMYQHHSDEVARAAFYGDRAILSTAEPSVTLIFNDTPSTVKSFNLLNYEGTKQRIDAFTTQDIGGITYNDGEFYNLTAQDGWYCESITTDLQDGQVLDFIDKEGKKYASVAGTLTTSSNLDTSEFQVQGLGMATIAVDTTSDTDVLQTLTIQDDASNAFQFGTITSSVSTHGQGTTLSGTKSITISPSENYVVQYNNITINGVGDGSANVATSTSNQTLTYTSTAATTVSDRFSQIVIAQNGNDITVTFTLTGTMPDQDLTVNVDFD